MCDHLRETVSRYDREQKLLILLLVCPSCRDGAVVGTVPYEPVFRRGDPGGTGA